MTKKHFVALAKALSELRGKSDNTDSVDQAIRAIADVCSASNGRFDRDRFETACGL